MRRLVVSFLLATTALIVIPVAAFADAPTCQGVPATIVGTDGDDKIYGTDGDDVIVGLGGDDELSGRGGDDLICGGSGDDELKGGSGNDTIKGGGGSDAIYGHDGDDTLLGGSGRDHVTGNQGSDVVSGNRSRDTLQGGAGDDTMRGGPGADLIGGGYLDSAASGNDLIYGGSGPDTIWGGEGNAIVFGGRGEDRVYGETGDDTLNGGPHDDLLVGGAGIDAAVGGGGSDDCSAETIDCENSIPSLGNVEITLGHEFVTLKGRAHHHDPLGDIEYALKREESGLWVQPDGSMAAAKVWLPTTLDPLTQWDTDWSASIELRRGHYRLSVRAMDADGDRDYLRPRPTFSVRRFGMEIGLIKGGTDLFTYFDIEVLPDGTRLGRGDRDGRGNPIPANGFGQTIRIPGAAHDGFDSIDFVEVAVQDTTTGLWLQTDGGFGSAEARHPADCPQCDEGGSTSWLFDAELADGDYHLVAYGTRFFPATPDVAQIEWDFAADGTIDEMPTVTVDQPMGSVFPPDAIAFSGTATDNFGVNRVRVSIRDRATGLWLQSLHLPLRWDDYKRAFPVELASPDEPITNWSVDALRGRPLELPPGSYNLSVAVHDGAMHRGSINPWLTFEVADP
ncbi:MAG: calcium-binding protein [bacterium]|nr:calcium-binding protein [bacterium]